MDSFIRVLYQGREVWMDLDSYLREACDMLNRKQQGAITPLLPSMERHLLPDVSEVIGDESEDE